MNILKLPKWAQELIQRQKYDEERLQRSLTAAETKCEKQSEEIQALLDIVRVVRPDIYDRWNHGSSLLELADMTKIPNQCG